MNMQPQNQDVAPLRELLVKLGRALAASVQVASVTLGKHHAESGRQVEAVIRRFLRERLPDRIGVGSGFIIGSDGTPSPQSDIVLYDALYSPRFTGISDSDYFFADQTLAVIQVTKRLDNKIKRGKQKLGKLDEEIERSRKTRGLSYFQKPEEDFADPGPLFFAVGVLGESSDSNTHHGVPLAKELSRVVASCSKGQERALLPNGLFLVGDGSSTESLGSAFITYVRKDKSGNWMLATDPAAGDPPSVCLVPYGDLSILLWLVYLIDRMRLLLEHRSRQTAKWLYFDKNKSAVDGDWQHVRDAFGGDVTMPMIGHLWQALWSGVDEGKQGLHQLMRPKIFEAGQEVKWGKER